MATNQISIVTRRYIADAITAGNFYYAGRLKEADFLNRLYDLKSMPSTDYRAQYNNAYKDIYQHMDMNNDWERDWVFTDDRFNLMHCDDQTYLKFLSETLHPSVRIDDGSTEQMLHVYNKYLAVDGYQLVPGEVISEKPMYKPAQNKSSEAHLASKTAGIKKYLNTDYIQNKITQMTKAVESDTDLALGTGKELLETVCKSILKQKTITIDQNWTVLQLIRKTTDALDFKPKEADNPEAAERSIKQILGGISTIVQGVTELRNNYGTGHGKDADFKGLEKKYAQLFVGVVSEIAIIYLATNGETELVENDDTTDDLPF